MEKVDVDLVDFQVSMIIRQEGGVMLYLSTPP